jgi:hypothetical protein
MDRVQGAGAGAGTERAYTGTSGLQTEHKNKVKKQRLLTRPVCSQRQPQQAWLGMGACPDRGSRGRCAGGCGHGREIVGMPRQAREGERREGCGDTGGRMGVTIMNTSRKKKKVTYGRCARAGGKTWA